MNSIIKTVALGMVTVLGPTMVWASKEGQHMLGLEDEKKEQSSASSKMEVKTPKKGSYLSYQNSIEKAQLEEARHYERSSGNKYDAEYERERSAAAYNAYKYRIEKEQK